MANAIPARVVENGNIDDLGPMTVTTSAASIHTGSRRTMAVTIQNDPSGQTNVLVGSSKRQSLVLTPGSSYTIHVGDANEIYVRTASGTATINRHLLVP